MVGGSRVKGWGWADGGARWGYSGDRCLAILAVESRGGGWDDAVSDGDSNYCTVLYCCDLEGLGWAGVGAHVEVCWATITCRDLARSSLLPTSM